MGAREKDECREECEMRIYRLAVDEPVVALRASLAARQAARLSTSLGAWTAPVARAGRRQEASSLVGGKKTQERVDGPRLRQRKPDFGVPQLAPIGAWICAVSKEHA